MKAVRPVVLDASTVVAGLALDHPTAREYLASSALFAPELIDLEVAQVLRKLVRSGRLEREVGQQAVYEWSRWPVGRCRHTGLLVRVWELRENLTAYDACYVALAESLEAQLVTLDGRIALAPHRANVIALAP